MYPDRDDMTGHAAPPAPTATILVVEDEVLIRMALAEYLRECGFRVFEASSTRDAQAVLLAGAEIDLVFSDVYMPTADDGVALASWLGEHHPSVLVILTSGVEASLKAAQTACKNVVALVDKPYVHERLLGHIHGALAARGAA